MRSQEMGNGDIKDNSDPDKIASRWKGIPEPPLDYAVPVHLEGILDGPPESPFVPSDAKPIPPDCGKPVDKDIVGKPIVFHIV